MSGFFVGSYNSLVGLSHLGDYDPIPDDYVLRPALVVAKEDRTLVVLPEDRTYTVEPEDRVFIVN